MGNLSLIKTRNNGCCIKQQPLFLRLDYPFSVTHLRMCEHSREGSLSHFPSPSRTGALMRRLSRLLHVWEEMPYPWCFQHLDGVIVNNK